MASVLWSCVYNWYVGVPTISARTLLGTKTRCMVAAVAQKVDSYELQDQFEWDLNSTTNNPDAFAIGECA
jgi:hypothetical protein